METIIIAEPSTAAIGTTDGQGLKGKAAGLVPSCSPKLLSSSTRAGIMNVTNVSPNIHDTAEQAPDFLGITWQGHPRGKWRF